MADRVQIVANRAGTKSFYIPIVPFEWFSEPGVGRAVSDLDLSGAIDLIDGDDLTLIDHSGVEDVEYIINVHKSSTGTRRYIGNMKLKPNSTIIDAKTITYNMDDTTAIYLCCAMNGDHIVRLGFIYGRSFGGIMIYYTGEEYFNAFATTIVDSNHVGFPEKEAIEITTAATTGGSTAFSFTNVPKLYSISEMATAGWFPKIDTSALAKYVIRGDGDIELKQEAVGDYSVDNTGMLNFINWCAQYVKLLGNSLVEYIGEGIPQSTSDMKIMTLDNGKKIRLLGPGEIQRPYNFTIQLVSSNDEFISNVSVQYTSIASMPASGKYFTRVYLAKNPYTETTTNATISVIGIGLTELIDGTQYWVMNWMGDIINPTTLPTTADALEGTTQEKKTKKKKTQPESQNPGGNDNTTGGGGEGQYDKKDQVDSVDIPTADSSVSITGEHENNFAHIYNPTDGEMRQLATWMTDDNAIVAIKKYFVNDPMDFIVSYHSVPGTVSKSDNKTNIGIGTYQAQQVSMWKVTNDMITIDCGSIEVYKVWGSANDYAPHVNMQVYLPFIGFQTLDANTLLPPQSGKKIDLHLQYIVNVLTGAITACLYKVIGEGGVLKNVIIGEYGGNAMYKYPITSKNHDNAINAGISLAASAMSMAVGGVMSKMTTGKAITKIDEAAAPYISNLAGQGVSDVTGMAESIGNPVVLHGGGIQGSTAFNMGKIPYLIVSRSHQALPENYQTVTGYPAHIFKQVNHATLSNGYLRYSQIDIKGVTGTDAEKKEIESLLLGGVYY